MEKKTAPFFVERKGYHIHWDAIPAWVCTQCGEPLFEDQAVEKIQQALSLLDKENEFLTKAS
jgi:YgiT-type zinc finger domain-containing protein